MIMMAKVTVEVTQEDLWSWLMTRIMEGKLFIIREVRESLCPCLSTTSTETESFIFLSQLYFVGNTEPKILCLVTRYTQTAVASFGPRRQTECGQKPGGFTRLTSEVLDWIKTVTRGG